MIVDRFPFFFVLDGVAFIFSGFFDGFEIKVLGKIQVGKFPESFLEGNFGPGRRKIDFLFLIGNCGRVMDGLRKGVDKVLSSFHDVFVIFFKFVPFENGKFRMVLVRRGFVSKSFRDRKTVADTPD